MFIMQVESRKVETCALNLSKNIEIFQKKANNPDPDYLSPRQGSLTSQKVTSLPNQQQRAS
jgi:hypothetical protein